MGPGHTNFPFGLARSFNSLPCCHARERVLLTPQSSPGFYQRLTSGESLGDPSADGTGPGLKLRSCLSLLSPWAGCQEVEFQELCLHQMLLILEQGMSREPAVGAN